MGLSFLLLGLKVGDHLMRVWGRHLLFYIIHKSGLYYKTPSNLSYLWNFGFFALFFLILQILTGIFLAMFYNPEPLHAFASILYINNEIIMVDGSDFSILMEHLFFLQLFICIWQGVYILGRLIIQGNFYGYQGF